MCERGLLLATLLVSLLGCASTVNADEDEPGLRNWQGYGFFAVGARPADGQGAYAVGGGAQRFISGSGFALGVQGHSFDFIGCGSCGALIVSATAAYELRGGRPRRKLTPFVGVGGGSALADGFGVGVVSSFAGANYWLSERIAVSLGAHADFTSEGDSYVYFRSGITF